jgi:hypothetical protein
MRTGSGRHTKKIAQLILHRLWIAVMGVYWALADYGRNFALLAVWLVASLFFFYWRYLAVLAPLMSKVGSLDMNKLRPGAGAGKRRAIRWPSHHRQSHPSAVRKSRCWRRSRARPYWPDRAAMRSRRPCPLPRGRERSPDRIFWLALLREAHPPARSLPRPPCLIPRADSVAV